eukprot:TRINITY_DN629_c0_g1_i1.p1 TRINITY_DN629_c0_g1~~TRINITY_DN629_c0_g1_i1.p1  ORF type:complete len:235 (+),score=88.30 TRINITY_DN629_c0_g1_i1:67-705(+)
MSRHSLLLAVFLLCSIQVLVQAGWDKNMCVTASSFWAAGAGSLTLGDAPRRSICVTLEFADLPGTYMGVDPTGKGVVALSPQVLRVETCSKNNNECLTYKGMSVKIYGSGKPIQAYDEQLKVQRAWWFLRCKDYDSTHVDFTGTLGSTTLPLLGLSEATNPPAFAAPVVSQVQSKAYDVITTINGGYKLHKGFKATPVACPPSMTSEIHEAM